MKMIKLEWKDFNVDIAAFDRQLRASYLNYVGNQAHTCVELWFSELSEEEQKEVEALWASMSKKSKLAKSYKSDDDIKKEQKAKKASALAKLKALGLDADEIEAILGQEVNNA